MHEEENRHAGKPGKPGERGTGQHGGEGGAGGAGGEGGETGGIGGAGGTGGQMGPAGPEGKRGPTNPRALIGYLILAAGVILGFVWTYGQGKENEKAVVALCEIRADQQRDITRTNKLLADDPGDIFGIPRELIIAGRDDTQRTFETLAILDCPPD